MGFLGGLLNATVGTALGVVVDVVEVETENASPKAVRGERCAASASRGI